MVLLLRGGERREQEMRKGKRRAGKGRGAKRRGLRGKEKGVTVEEGEGRGEEGKEGRRWMPPSNSKYTTGCIEARGKLRTSIFINKTSRQLLFENTLH